LRNIREFTLGEFPRCLFYIFLIFGEVEVHD
jgi:hypothetical protein